MPAIGSMLSAIPLAAHIGYAAATASALPARMGQTAEGGGMRLPIFLIAWFGVIGAANLAFFLLHVSLPRLPEGLFQVPGRTYWLSTPKNRAILISHLRGIIEAALLGLNLFFLAVYQSIYQANATEPLMRFPMPILAVGFMIFPLLFVAIAMMLMLRRLAVESKPTPPCDDTDQAQ